jgi:hypothetical protein
METKWRLTNTHSQLQNISYYMFAFIIQYRPYVFVTVEGAIMFVFTSEIFEKIP